MTPTESRQHFLMKAYILISDSIVLLAKTSYYHGITRITKKFNGVSLDFFGKFFFSSEMTCPLVNTLQWLQK